MSAREEDVPLLTLQISVCSNCVRRVAGECHVPGCFYWMRGVENVPLFLDAYVVEASETDVERIHHQTGRSDGSWGCACGWVQDKPHVEHVADMVAAAAVTS